MGRGQIDLATLIDCRADVCLAALTQYGRDAIKQTGNRRLPARAKMNMAGQLYLPSTSSHQRKRLTPFFTHPFIYFKSLFSQTPLYHGLCVTYRPYFPLPMDPTPFILCCMHDIHNIMSISYHAHLFVWVGDEGGCRDEMEGGGGGGWHGEWGSPIGTGRTPDTGVLERPPLGFPAPDIASMAATDPPEVLVAVYAGALLPLSRAIPRAI